MNNISPENPSTINELELQKEQQRYYARSHALDIAVKLNISSVNKDADSIIAEAKKIENYLLNG